MAAGVLITLVVRFRHYRLWEVVTLLALAALANLAIRSLQDWLLMMFALGVPQITALLRDRAVKAHRSVGATDNHTTNATRIPTQREESFTPPSKEGDTRGVKEPFPWFTTSAVFHNIGHSLEKAFVGSYFRWQPRWLMAGVVGLAVLTLVMPVANAPFAAICDCPVRAVDFMERQQIRGRVFAPPNYGAYLGWRRRDQVSVYVDTRGFFFPPVLLEDSHYLPQLRPGWHPRWQRVVSEYETEYFLLETQGVRGQLWRRLQQLQVEPLYLDDHCVLLRTQEVEKGFTAMIREAGTGQDLAQIHP